MAKLWAVKTDIMGPKRKRQESSNLTLDPERENVMKKMLEKHFTYSQPEGVFWKLPESGVLDKHVEPWQIDDLICLKMELNNLKDKLSDKVLSDWHQHTTFMNVASSVIQMVKQNFYPEFCTQAWCKFYEIISRFPIVDLKSPFVHSVHLCEAPGAFVTSLNHFLHSNGYRNYWQWAATTLNPYYEGNDLGQMIDDDRFLRNTWTQWNFGRSNTGNLMDWNNMCDLTDFVNSLQPIHLVTADGSIDCQNIPDEQERVVSHLHYCEALTAILLLAPGGSLVIKMFTMFEGSSVCLMYLLNCLFEQVHVFKPATSRPGNSEVYVVCCKFLGLEDHESFRLLAKPFFGSVPPEGCIFHKTNIPESFIKEHIRCCTMFKAHQGEIIQNNIDTYGKVTEEMKCRIEMLKDYFVELFINHYSLRRISKSQKIVQKGPPQRNLVVTNVTQTDTQQTGVVQHKRHAGTLINRQKIYFLPWKQKIYTFQEYVANRELKWLESNWPPTELDTGSWICLTGKSPEEVCSSRFCHGRLLSEMQDVLKNSKWQAYQKAAEKSSVQDFVSGVESLIHELDCGLIQKKSCVHSLYTEGSDNDHIITEVEEKLGIKVQTVGDSTILTDNAHHILYLIVTPPAGNKYPELAARYKLFQGVLYLYKNWEQISSVIIKLNTALTRFTAGLLYLLRCSFLKVGLMQQPMGETLGQFLVCKGKMRVPTGLQAYMISVCKKMSTLENQPISVLEIVPMHVILDDVQFSKWLQTANETVIKSFITDILREEKKGYESEQNSL